MLDREEQIDAPVLGKLKHGVHRDLRNSSRVDECDDQRFFAEAQTALGGNFDPILWNDFGEVGLGMLGYPLLQGVSELGVIFDEDKLAKVVIERNQRRARKFFAGVLDLAQPWPSHHV